MIQIDMPMPKNCADCCFANADLVNGIITLYCMTPVGRKMYASDLISRKDRPDWCPLKERKTVEPIKPLDKDDDYTFLCSNCKGELFCGDVLHDNFCPTCGREVKWE